MGSRLDNPLYMDLHYYLVAQTGAGKSVLTDELFRQWKNSVIYFNTQLNELTFPKTVIITETAEDAFQAYLTGNKKIVLNPISDSKKIVDIINHTKNTLTELIDLLVGYKYELQKEGRVKESAPVTVMIEEVQWFQDFSYTNDSINFIAKNGRLMGIFLFAITQEAISVNNRIKTQAHVIYGYLEQHNHQYLEEKVGISLTKPAFRSYDFYWINWRDNKKVKLHVNL